MPQLKRKPVVIGSGQALSGEADLEGRVLVGVVIPAAWSAANLTFQGAAAPGGTFQDVYDDAGTEYVVTAAASRHIAVQVLEALQYVKVRSGTAGTPVNQVAERTVTLITKAKE
jgi:hypothetical protein